MVDRLLAVRINKALQQQPAVAILGPRQVGKTTLALRQIQPEGKERLYLDLERPSDALKLEDAEFFLDRHKDKLVIIDEVQRMPALFPVLRALIDMHRAPGRFVLLGSASDALIQMSSESLAGRISYLELHPFSLSELPAPDWPVLWVRGGYPLAYLAQDDESAFEWTGDFVRTYIERELGVSSLRTTAPELALFLRILASAHGQLTNYSELAKVMQLSIPTIKRYIQFFEQAYLLRTLYPYHPNVQKRLVKSPKIYIRDSGLLHYLRGIQSLADLEGDMLRGASWEGFVIQQILSLIKPSVLPYFYRTGAGAEMDLVLVKGNRPFAAFEFKYSNSPKITKGATEALKDLNCPHQYVITPSSDLFEWRPGLWIAGISDVPNILRGLGLAITA